jgi:REP-associated tyrosine transposase
MSDWPHAPVHRLGDPGAYFITAGTYRKEHHFRTADRLDRLRDLLFSLASSYRFPLQAWAIFSNHYHFIATAEHDASSMKMMIAELHSVSAREVNCADGARGRQVWYQFWDKHLTFERSYLARLNYVHQNPVHHRLVNQATNYRWCSASWFESQVSRAFAQSVRRFGSDRLRVVDDFF